MHTFQGSSVGPMVLLLVQNGMRMVLLLCFAEKEKVPQRAAVMVLHSKEMLALVLYSEKVHVMVVYPEKVHVTVVYPEKAMA